MYDTSPGMGYWVIGRIPPQDDDDEELWAALPIEGAPGILLGNMEQVSDLRDALTDLIEDRAFDQNMGLYDESLGWLWLTVSEASDKYGVPPSTLRYWMQNMSEDAKMEHGRWKALDAAIKGYVNKWKRRKREQDEQENS